MEEGASVMSGLLENGTTVLTWVLTSIGEVCEVIVAQPLLLLGTICMLIGFVYGIIRRSISTF